MSDLSKKMTVKSEMLLVLYSVPFVIILCFWF